jgi:hypothetical protein
LRFVKSHGKIILVKPASAPSPEQYESELDAELALANMTLYEDLTGMWERETDAELRRDFAQLYRDVIGIDVERREEFREAMERIKQGSTMVVQDVVAILGGQLNRSNS